MNLKEKKVLVVGTGKSGIGAANLLLSIGAVPVLYDEKADFDTAMLLGQLQDATKVELITGNLSDKIISSLELAVLSPGVPMDSEIAVKLIHSGCKIWGEIELAYQFEKGKILAITGTNGKTTTTTLLGKILKDHYDSVFVVGNIGNPYTEEALKTKEGSITVAEISSFQLETIEAFRPDVSAVLNLTPDHLNRHKTMEEYAKTKFQIAKNQTENEVCVLNYEDEYCRTFAKDCKARIIYFSSARRLEEGFYLEDDKIVQADEAGSRELLSIHEMNLLGTHNVENVMAAIAMAAAFGVPMEQIVETIRVFQSVEHRIEYVATKQGVDYYNDSKGTNPDAAIRGIRAMRKPTILLGGGYDKGSEYDEWILSFEGRVKCLVLIGQTREKIEECARKNGFSNIVLADTFEEAMEVCVSRAVPGDAVLLSPACASWGMFPNYEVRGNCFKEYVNRIKE